MSMDRRESSHTLSFINMKTRGAPGAPSLTSWTALLMTVNEFRMFCVQSDSEVLCDCGCEKTFNTFGVIVTTTLSFEAKIYK